MTESEFDRKISEELSNINITDKIHDTTVTAWFVPFKYISWGLILTSITLNLWGLEIILPLIGAALLFLGLRMMRNAGKAFRSAYILSAVYTLLHLISIILSKNYSDSYFGVVIDIITIAMILTLRHAVIQADSKAIPKLSKDPFIWAVLMILSLYVLSTIPELGMFTGFIWIVMFIIVARLIFKTGDALNRDCCVLQDSKILVNGKAVMCIYLALGVACFVFANHPTPKFVPYESPDMASEARAELSENDFPEKAVQCLTDKDVELLNYDLSIHQKTTEDVFYIEEYDPFVPHEKAADYDKTNSVSVTRIYFTDVKDSLCVIEIFELGENMNCLWGDGAIIWNSADILQIVGGELFYTKDGVQYRHEIKDFNQIDSSNEFFSSGNSRYSIKVSFPFNCEKRYGYIIYRTGLDVSGTLTNGVCSLDWYHRKYPVCLPDDANYSWPCGIDFCNHQFCDMFSSADFNNKRK